MKNVETITEFGTGIVYASDLNDKIKSGEIDDVILFSEALQEKMIADLAEEIAAAGKRIVLVAGPSSSGKTSFTKRLCVQLWINGRKPIYIGTDDYFIARDKMKKGPDGVLNFENLDALDVELFNKQIKQLIDGETVDLPRFDFIAGHPVFGERHTKANPGQVIVVEGIHGLNPVLASDIHPDDCYRVFIQPITELKISASKKIQTSDVRKLRRMVRDNAHRGWKPEQTLEVWETVRNGELENIIPFMDSADCYFDSALVYELAALKKHVAPLLSEIQPGSPFYPEAQRQLDILDNVLELPEERLIPSNSILREFIGGSSVVD